MKRLLPLILLFCGNSLFSQSYNSGLLNSKALTLRRFMEQNHIQPVNWNDSSSAMLFDKWIDELDEDKLFFTQADIKELSAYKNKLDEELMNKGWGFFDASVKLYKKRLLQTDSMAKLICKIPFDFSKPDKITWPFTSFTENEFQLFSRWQKYYKFKMLRQLTSIDSISKHENKLPPSFPDVEKKIRAAILKRHDAAMYRLLQPSPEFEKDRAENYLNTICWMYDPHSNYFTLSKKEEFNTALSGFEFSTGLNVNQNDNGQWEVVQLLPGGPAWNSGQMHTGDILLKIKEGNKPEMILEDMNEEEVYEMLQGTSNENITVTFKTKAGTVLTTVLKKERIENEEGVVKSFLLGTENKVGYIKLPDFYTQEDDEEEDKGCANDLAKEIVKLKKDSIKGLILDLRYNGGGSIWEAIQLAGIFIDQGTMVTTKYKDGVHFLRDPNRGTIYDGPLLVMINGQSASASELVSAVLQDYNRALIVGSRSFGKGTAQGIFALDTNSLRRSQNADDFVKVTSGKFYRVDGNTTQWKGVEPDIPLPDYIVSDKYRENGYSSALKPDNVKQAIFKPLPELPVEALKKNSEGRSSSNATFKAVKALADVIMQGDKGMEFPLTWKEFAAVAKKMDAVYAVMAERDEKKEKLLPVNNNSFDQKQYILNNTETNKRYISIISTDDYVAECYRILMDFVKLKN